MPAARGMEPYRRTTTMRSWTEPVKCCLLLTAPYLYALGSEKMRMSDLRTKAEVLVAAGVDARPVEHAQLSCQTRPSIGTRELLCKPLWGLQSWLQLLARGFPLPGMRPAENSTCADETPQQQAQHA